MESSALVYIGLTLLTVFLGLFVHNQEYVGRSLRGGRKFGEPFWTTRQEAQNRVCIFAVWFLMTAVSACRIAVGNDYWVYRQNFDLISQQRHVSSEIGFNLIVRFFQWVFNPGKVQYLSIFAFFSVFTVFFFVKALKDQGEWFAFSLFLLMTGGFYFNSLNSVRYYFALAVAMYSIKYVLRGEYLKFITLIFLGMFIHKSILLVIPGYLIAIVLAKAKWKKWHFIVGGVFLASLILCRNFYREILFFFYPFYRNSVFDNGKISWINLLKCICVLALCMFCYRKSLLKSVENRFYATLNLFGLIVYCCGSFIPETSRIGYYFIISQVFLLPRLIMGIEISWFRRLVFWGTIAAFTLYFVLLLRGMYATDIRLLPYLNWIFH